MPKVIIDGKEITVDAGTTILKAAEQLGIYIPHFCYHPAFSKPANCRICVVEIKGAPKLSTSCSTPVQDGMEVLTNSEKVKEERESVMEFLLINHPLDCPECDQAGECRLQDYSFLYGKGHSRFREEKRVKPHKDFGEHIVLHTNRCILCTRCVRFCEEIAGVEELGVFDRGGQSQIDVFPGRKLENKLAGNVVDICPVGALVDKDFLHKTRVWNLTSFDSICPLCSKGCSIRIDVKDNKIQRIKPRTNADVNGYWICDFGRYDYHKFDDVKRAEYPQIKEMGRLSRGSWKKALEKVNITINSVTNEYGNASAAGVGNAFSSNEENFLLRHYMTSCIKSGNIFLYHINDNGYEETFKDGFRIEPDKNPNKSGASLCLGLNDSNGSFDVLLNKIDSGEIKALYFLHSNLNDTIDEKTIETLKKLDFLAVQSIFQSQLTEIADVVLPSACFSESDGTYINSSGRVQRYFKAIAPAGLAKEGWDILNGLISRCGGDLSVSSAGDVFNAAAEQVSELKDLTFYKLGNNGVSIK